MSLTITVPDLLATRLRSRAEAEQVSVEGLAHRILQDGLEQPVEPAKWRTLNRRRVALIEKRFTGSLSEQEQQELQILQAMADRQLEDLDAKMLEDVSRMEAAARELCWKP